MPRVTAIALCAMGIFGTPSLAVVIDFSNLTPGTAVTNQYPSATFSSIPLKENRVQNDFNFGANSTPNYICTAAVGGELDCSSPVYVDFTSPVGGLTFYALGDDAAGTPATVDVYNGANLLGTTPITVDGNFNTVELVDLTGYPSVTRIEISANTDINGLAYDTFEFTTVPEPVGLALSAAAIGRLTLLRARRSR